MSIGAITKKSRNAKIRHWSPYPDRCKTQQISNKAVIENSGMLESVLDQCRTQEMCDKAVDNYRHALKFVPSCFKIQDMCYKVVNTYPCTIQFKTWIL